MRLEKLADAEYTRISGGERQLTLIARALAQSAPLLVMDEPTASLDFGNQVRVLEQIAQLAAEWIGILLSTHDPDHAFLVADRVALLHGGGLLAMGTPDSVVTSASLRAVYGVDVAVSAVGIAGASRPVCLPALTPGARRTQ